MATGVALEVATFGGYTIALGVHESVGIALVTSGCAMTAYHAQDLSWSTSTPKAPSMDWGTYQDTRDFITDAHGNIIYASKDKEPPYNGKELGNDPTKPPAEGFEWKGNGKPGSGEGSWVKGEGRGKEILYPDLDHSPPVGPHWDYTSPDFPRGTRLYPDGTWELKK